MPLFGRDPERGAIRAVLHRGIDAGFDEERHMARVAFGHLLQERFRRVRDTILFELLAGSRLVALGRRRDQDERGEGEQGERCLHRILLTGLFTEAIARELA
jgi:hypothetical protein